MTKRWTSTRSGVQPKRLASKRRRKSWRMWGVIDDLDFYGPSLWRTRRAARDDAQSSNRFIKDGKFRIARVTITEE